MKEDFIIRQNFGTARYFRTVSEAFKGADYGNPYSYFKPAPKVVIRRLVGITVAAMVCAIVAWRFYV